MSSIVGNGCRMRVIKFLMTRFKTVAEAEDAYEVTYIGGNNPTQGSCSSGPSQLFNTDSSVPPADIISMISSGFSNLTSRQREQLLVKLFQSWLVEDINPNLDGKFVPQCFLPLVAKAMAVLHAGGKDNLIYHAACCFGEERQGDVIPRMPLDRMPFGLIAHNLKFFASDNVANIQAPDDYKSWCQSMYSLFGNKWASMHLGPMWSYEVSSDNLDAATCTDSSSLSLDILSQALQETFGENTSKSVGSTLQLAENVEENNSSCDALHVRSGRTIKGDPLMVSAVSD